MLLRAQYIVPISSEPFQDGAVLVRDGVIKDIGKTDIMRLRYQDEAEEDFGAAALMPGLVDLHTHLEDAVLRGAVNDMPYTPWLLAMGEKNSRLDVADWYDSAIMGGLEALSAGITCVADTTASGASCTAVQRLGLRGMIYREVGAMDQRRVDHAVRMAESDLYHWRQEVDADRISVGMAPAKLYSCHPAVFSQVAEFGARENAPIALHLAGSREEFNFVKYGSSVLSVHGMDKRRGYVEVPPWLPTGVTPVQYAMNWGAFDAPNVLAIHCVHVDGEDVKTLRNYDVSVASCPRCNAQMGMGVAPLTDFLKAGIRTGFGTDSPAATDSTDLFGELRLGMLMQRAVNPGDFLDSATVLRMATLGGAEALHMEDRIGSLDVGKCADIIAVDISGIHEDDNGNPTAGIVNACNSSDVIMTMVGGKKLYEKNQWHVDVEVAHNIVRVIEIRRKLRS